MKRWLAVVLAGAVTVACGDKDPVSWDGSETPPDQTNTTDYASRALAAAVDRSWTLQGTYRESVWQAVVPGSEVTLTLHADGRLTGSSGCNSYGGTYSLTDSTQIQVSMLAATEMACLGTGIMAQETEYLQSLAHAKALRVDDDQLRLYAGDTASYLQFAATPDTKDDDDQDGTLVPDTTVVDNGAELLAALTAGAWQLRYVEETTAGTATSNPTPSDVAITARFATDGSVSGRAGCNQYAGRFELAPGGRVAFHDLAITEMACSAGPLRDWEARYWELLRQVTAVRVDRDRLTLAVGPTAQPDGYLRFEAVEDPTAPDDPYAAREDTVRVGDAVLRYVSYPCDTTAEPTRAGTNTVISSDGKSLYFHHDLVTYCNAQTDRALLVEPELADGEIRVHLVFRGQAVRCQCTFPVRGVLEGVPPGDYTVSLVYHVELTGQAPQEPMVLSETQITLGDAAGTDDGDDDHDADDGRDGVQGGDDGDGTVGPDPGAPVPQLPIDADRQLRVADDGSSIDMPLVGVVEVALEANPSTGFTWLVAELDKAILEPLGEDFTARADGQVGAPGIQRLFFRAIAPGVTPLRLVYVRPWESVMPANTFAVEIVVHGGIAPPPVEPLPVDPAVEPLPVDSPVPPLGIRLGSSFGECRGYCWHEMILDAEAMVLVARGWEPASYPEKQYREPMKAELWQRLQGLADVNVLASMDEVYGCPDCADGGAEWLSMNLSGRMETVKFEFGSKLDPVAELLAVLRELKAGLQRQAGL